jgi:L-arabinose isomerase
MNAKTYIGKDSGKMHLEVNGITLATEGDVCRDATLRGAGVDTWTVDDLIRVVNLINNRVSQRIYELEVENNSLLASLHHSKPSE